MIGRAGFLGLLGVGVAGLFYGRDATGLLGKATPDFVSRIVPSSGWRIYTVGDSMPKHDPLTFQLTIGGLVDKPASLSLADLKALPRVDQISDFHCVTGWSVKDVHWGGVRIQSLLDLVGAHSSARGMQFVSAELPYHDSLTVEQALLPDVMIAYEMDGAPISRPHGAPVRLVVPQMYGYKSVKWVNQIELQTAPTQGYWEYHGYDADAWVGGSNGFTS